MNFESIYLEYKQARYKLTFTLDCTDSYFINEDILHIYKLISKVDDYEIINPSIIILFKNLQISKNYLLKILEKSIDKVAKSIGYTYTMFGGIEPNIDIQNSIVYCIMNTYRERIIVDLFRALSVFDSYSSKDSYLILNLFSHRFSSCFSIKYLTLTKKICSNSYGNKKIIFMLFNVNFSYFMRSEFLQMLIDYNDNITFDIVQLVLFKFPIKNLLACQRICELIAKFIWNNSANVASLDNIYSKVGNLQKVIIAQTMARLKIRKSIYIKVLNRMRFKVRYKRVLDEINQFMDIIL